VTLKKILGWAAVAFVIFYLITDPTGAAHAVSSITALLKTAGSSLETFFNSL
jgi:hypothetical protein